MEDKIIELLRKNRIGKQKAIYLAHELLFLFPVVRQSKQLVCDKCEMPYTREEMQVGHCFNCGEMD